MSKLSERLAALPPEKRALLTRRLMKARGHRREESQIPRQKRDGTLFPLSFSQERMWFDYQQAPERPLNHLSFCFTGPLEHSIVERCFSEIVRRHEAWRTTFREMDGRVLQVISPPEPVKIKEVNLKASGSQTDFEIQQIFMKEAERRFDLSQGPLFRGTLFHVADREPILLLVIHHLIIDGWSGGIFAQEMATLYKAFLFQKPSPLPELPIQYVDYVTWQRKRVESGDLQQQFLYWQKQLSGIPQVLALPTNRPRPIAGSINATEQRFVLDQRLTTALRALSRQEESTLFMTLLAAFKVLLHRYSGLCDMVVGTLIANRNRAEVKPLLGLFTNTLVLRTNLSGHPTFRELLRRVRNVSTEAFANQDFSFEKLVEALQPERTLNHHPLFQVKFNLRKAPTLAPNMPIKLDNQLLPDRTADHFDLYPILEETESIINGTLIYNPDLFDATTIEGMIREFKALLDDITLNPDQQITPTALLSL